MTRPYKYILVDGVPTPEDDLLKWGAWFNNADERRIARTEIGKVTISTVFLGLDHQWGDGAPILYETMIFGSMALFDDYQERYSDLEEAMMGHERAVALVRHSLDVRYSGLQGIWHAIADGWNILVKRLVG